MSWRTGHLGAGWPPSPTSNLQDRIITSILLTTSTPTTTITTMPSSTTSSSASQIRHIRTQTADTVTTANHQAHTTPHERLHHETLSKLTSLPPQTQHTTPSKLFSPPHLAAIESLRAAQLSLAQTYILSSTPPPPSTSHPNASTTNTTTSANANAAPNSSQAALHAEHEATEKERRGLDEAHQKIFSTSGTTTTGGEDGVSVDLQLARRRRAANQRLFERTREMVGVVGERLDVVAAAMRGVERESRGVWGSGDEKEGGMR
ncbi:hypothetical protein BJ508DRAFT_307044 [Ascobolus immersus RN42]|uniref:Uncharacterized protein n=1 Tax=Ascobolus immersus RN42 TaxID=1160509 RepID=A0A3N4I9H5_ASCIM|nr:hypothetical protein BJ508DRAFT_307044 [Ascobolus immersus RN42]